MKVGKWSVIGGCHAGTVKQCVSKSSRPSVQKTLSVLVKFLVLEASNVGIPGEGKAHCQPMLC